MRTHLHRSAAAASTVLLTLGLAACSGDDESAQAFCDSVGSLESLTTELGAIDPSDPDAATESLEQVISEIEAIEPPEEIAESFEVVSTAFVGYADAATEALADMENADTDALTEAQEAMSSEEFSSASADLDQYTTENCS
ncbi:hypothetical protein [Isoptericola aurantiacus]|uniref:hypothetical protein n=1 Tax=Isoptericola aurantiacus TaxID=3377839 RepID=UPI00383B44A9